MTGQTAEIPKIDQAKTRHDGYVLIMAIEEGLLDYYRRHFVDMGFTSLTAPTQEAGLALMRLLMFDFVVVDAGAGAFAGRRIVERGLELGYCPTILAASRAGKRDYRLKVINPEDMDGHQEIVTFPQILRMMEPRLQPTGHE